MLSLYHNAPTASTQTPVTPSVIDIGLVHKTLRKTLSTIQSLTRRYGFCFAALARVAGYSGHSVSTTRKHVRRLIALGMVRREAVPGYADRLFICPMSAWKSLLIGTQNGETHSIEYSSPLGTKNNKQQILTASKPLPLVEPVVVLSATPPEILESDEQEDLSAFRAYLESEEGTNADAALGGVETLDALADTAVASLAPVVSPARTERTPSDSVPTIKASPKPPLSPITPDQRSTVEQLVAAGVTRSTAAQAVQQDPARAEAALRAFLAYQQRKPIDCPTALYRVAFREAWKPTARQERASTTDRPVTASALGLVAAPASGQGATVTVQASAALRAMISSTRRAVNPLRC